MLVRNMEMRFPTVDAGRRVVLATLALAGSVFLAACGTAPSTRPVTELPLAACAPASAASVAEVAPPPRPTRPPLDPPQEAGVSPRPPGASVTRAEASKRRLGIHFGGATIEVALD